jgi:CIC family chloride channel protein
VSDRLRRSLDPRRAVDLARAQQTLLLAGITGAITGLGVAGFERLTGELVLDRVQGMSPWPRALMPLAGLLGAALVLHLARRSTPSTADEYIKAFHSTGRLSLGRVPARIVASVLTLGGGAPMGYEGPALYLGAGVGAALQRRLQRFLPPDGTKVLMVAGAAAGVAAIFKAPVTGLVFALEVPYQEDMARRMLLPAALSAAASYVVFAAIIGTSPILPVAGQPPFDLADLGGAALVGLACGVLARAFTALLRIAKRLSSMGNPFLRAALGGLAIAGTVGLAELVSDGALAIGPGYGALRWALAPDRALLAVVAIATLRVVGTVAAVGGGGAGGLFIPLVIQGAMVGRVMSGMFEASNATLFPVLGMAAFLGAGYRVPLAAVVFVAEFTGRPGFVVPGLVAAVVAQLVMGRSSVSAYQVAGRVGHLEGRLRMPIATLISADARTAPSDATIEEVFWHHMIAAKQHVVVIVDGSTYRGVVRADDLAQLERDAWPTTVVTDVMRADVAIASPDWLLGEAIAVMERDDIEVLPVCSGEQFVGVVTTSDLVSIDEIIDRTEADRP